MKPLSAAIVFTSVICLCLPPGSAAAEHGARPNCLLILADDLGYGDLACYGHPRVQTPHIDRLAAQGLRLTSCYSAAANCSPARAGLMTGRTPSRVGIYNWIPGLCPMHVQRSEITIATLLRNAGYDTCQAGKWHLNGDLIPFGTPATRALYPIEGLAGVPDVKTIKWPSQPQPWDHGFGHWFATQNNALPNHHDPVNFVRNGKPVGPLRGYAADLVADEAISWMESRRDATRPFFLFLCFHEPHEPIASAKKYTDLYPSDDPSYAAHHGNITQMDAACGRVLAALDRLKLRQDTLVVFTSDNGPAITGIHPHGSAGPLRDKKGSIYEGGIRVPGILRWPGHIQPGTTSDVAVSGVDFLPTMCGLAGIDVPEDRVLDGVSLLPLLRGQPLVRHHPLYWQFHRARSRVKVAIRDGDWKLCAALTSPTPKPSGGIAEGELAALKSAELTGFELYDLKQDVGERRNVAQARPEVLATLRDKLIRLHHEVRAEGPLWPAWEWPRYESQRIEWPEYWKRRKKR